MQVRFLPEALSLYKHMPWWTIGKSVAQRGVKVKLIHHGGVAQRLEQRV